MSTIPAILSGAATYDIETFPNCVTLHMELLEAPASQTWEISAYRDDRHALLAWLNNMRMWQRPMVGFNSVGFDYVVVHYLMQNPLATVEQLYAKAQHIIQSNDRFANTIWASDRMIPQVDLFLMNHFDNRAKTTSLKALQVNMRSQSVVDSPVPFGTALTREEIDQYLIPYNRHDVTETKAFAMHCMPALSFRAGLIDQFGIDVLNFNDTKIGTKILEHRLGDGVCYYRDATNRRQPRQTPRNRIALADIIFPYVRFEHPEFQRVLDYMRAQVLTPEDIEDETAPVQTKGVFSKLSAQVGGLDFHFGTGGVHGSVTAQRFVASEEWPIRDIDVAGMYPAIAIANRLAPQHLGDVFVNEYAQLPIERKKYPKGTVENASLKLAGNGTYGNTNNRYSVFYDPSYTMTVTINGQLMICMLAEWLSTVPTIRLISANTDGITYQIHRDWEPQAALQCKMWEATTGLTLESADYARMWIADVNTYIAETTDGKLKQKGRLWHPDPDNYALSISEASPPAWHKDLGNIASIRAAVQAMVSGVDPELWLLTHRDPFDFMCRARCDRASKLMLGDREMPRTLRYYVARQGEPLSKVSPPAGPEGWYKRANGVSEIDYTRVMTETGGEWSEAVCTKNKSRYVTRRTNIETGFLVAECNDASHFDWGNVNYDWYLAEARKLIVY